MATRPETPPAVPITSPSPATEATIDRASTPIETAARPAWSFPPPLTPPPRPGAAPPPPPASVGRAGGNWFTTTPPRTIVTLGFALLLVSCVATTVGRGLVGGGLDPLAVCLGPLGVGLIVFALVRMAARRPRRRF